MMSQSMRTFLLVGVPYAAILLFVAGVVWRARKRVTISSMSSQVLENRLLVWGAVPFHFGILVVVLGHLLPLLFPGTWQSIVSHRPALLTIESIGMGAAMLAVIGLGVLLARRLGSAAVRAGSRVADVAVVVLLIAQALMGLFIATAHRWGAVWSARTTTPYLWSIFTLHPEPSFVAGLPLLVTLHIVLAWVILALIPFTRLIHMFFFPLQYLWRRPQQVVWLAERPVRTPRTGAVVENSRGAARSTTAG